MQAPDDVATADAIWNVISTAWQTNQLASLSTSAVLQQVDLLHLDGTAAMSSYTTPGTGKWAGPQPGDPEIAVATLIKISTAHRGPANRGRIFLPFTSESIIANGALTGSVVAQISTAWQAFNTALQAGTPSMILGVASYARPPSHGSPHFTPLLNISCEPLAGTQRRRQGRLRK